MSPHMKHETKAVTFGILMAFHICSYPTRTLNKRSACIIIMLVAITVAHNFLPYCCLLFMQWINLVTVIVIHMSLLKINVWNLLHLKWYHQTTMDNLTLGFVLQSPNKIFKICAQYYSLSFPNGKIILKRQNLNVIKRNTNLRWGRKIHNLITI